MFINIHIFVPTSEGCSSSFRRQTGCSMNSGGGLCRISPSDWISVHVYCIFVCKSVVYTVFNLVLLLKNCNKLWKFKINLINKNNSTFYFKACSEMLPLINNSGIYNYRQLQINSLIFGKTLNDLLYCIVLI